MGKHTRFNGIDIHIEETERYVQINDINESDLLRIWDTIKTTYAGFAYNVCFRNTALLYNALRKISATLLEDCIGMELTAG